MSSKCVTILKEVMKRYFGWEKYKSSLIYMSKCLGCFFPQKCLFHSYTIRSHSYLFVRSEENHESGAKLMKSLCSQILGNSCLKVKSIQLSFTKNKTKNPRSASWLGSQTHLNRCRWKCESTHTFSLTNTNTQTQSNLHSHTH